MLMSLSDHESARVLAFVQGKVPRLRPAIPPEDQADVVSGVMEHILRDWDKYNPARGPLGHWLWLYIRQGRREYWSSPDRAGRYVPLAKEHEQVADPRQARAGQAHDIALGLARLPQDERTLLIQVQVEGVPLGEAAGALGLSERVAWRRLQRAKSRLRRYLK